MPTRPFPYQIIGARKIEAFRGRALLADEQGLGKTFQAYLWLRRHPELRPAVIVCPAGLKWVWQHEAWEHFKLRVEVLESTTPQRKDYLRKPNILVLNYEILPKTRRKGAGEGWLEWLKAINPKVIVIDEAQAVRNRSSLQTKAVRKLCAGVPHVIALTGTPLVNRPAELWSVLNVLRPDLFPSFFPFGLRYAGGRRRPWGWEFKGATRLPELHRILKRHVMVRRTKTQIYKDLPPLIRGVVPVELSNRREYEEALNNFIKWLRKNHPGRITAATRAMRLTHFGYLKHLIGKLKLPAVTEWIECFLREGEGKLLMYGWHHDVLNPLYEKFQGQAVLVNGTVTGEKRRAEVDRFQHHPETRLFVGNIQAAGTGLTLTAAHTGAFCELGWTPGEHSQVEHRCFARVNDLHGANWYYLVAKGTVEERLCKLIQDKQKVLSAVLDGGKREGDFDVFDILCSEILEGKNDEGQ